MNYKQRRYVGSLWYDYQLVLLQAFANCEQRLSASSCLSVRPSVRTEQLGSHRTNIHEISYSSIFRESVEKIQVLLNMTIAGTLHEDLRTFMIISRLILLRMINVSDKNCGENQNTQFNGFLTMHHSVELKFTTNLMHNFLFIQ
jgi:hypothetical protein